MIINGFDLSSDKMKYFEIYSDQKINLKLRGDAALMERSAKYGSFCPPGYLQLPSRSRPMASQVVAGTRLLLVTCSSGSGVLRRTFISKYSRSEVGQVSTYSKHRQRLASGLFLSFSKLNFIVTKRTDFELIVLAN